MPASTRIVTRRPRRRLSPTRGVEFTCRRGALVAKRTTACSVSGCARPNLARSYCSLHWQRWRKNGAPGPAEPVRRQHAVCAVEECDRAHYAHGFCGAHWRRWSRSGDPGPVEIRTTKTDCCIPDCDDPHSARGYCASHYARWNRTGDAGAAFSYRRRNPCERDDQGRKQCRVCDKWLPETTFSRNSASTDGRSPRCTNCHYAAFIARRYGVEPDWYTETLRKQGGGCAICGTIAYSRRLHVDHDHTHCAPDRGCPRCVRGLLCGPCNTGLGMFGEDEARLLAALDYLALVKAGPPA